MLKRMALLILIIVVGDSMLPLVYVGRDFASYAPNNSLIPIINASTPQSPDISENNPPPVIDRFEQIGRGNALGEREFIISLLVSILTGLVLVLKCVLYFKASNYKPEQVLQSFAVIFIIGGALLLITAGYTSADIAPVIGLFGTIAGYLIGREQSRGIKAQKPSPRDEVS